MTSATRRSTSIVPVAAAVFVLLLAGCGGSIGGPGSGVAQPVSSYLGAPSNDVPAPYQGLYWFKRVGPVLRQRGKVELLFMGTPWDAGSAVDSWPVVKALDQFGKWTGLRSGMAAGQNTGCSKDTAGHTYCLYTGARCFARGSVSPAYCMSGVPEVDWTHATYTSRYVTFSYQNVRSRPRGPLRRLPRLDQTLFYRYMALPQQVMPQFPLPAIAVDGYAMHGAIDDPTSILFEDTKPAGAVDAEAFAKVQKALQTGDLAGNFQTSYYNMFANILTAFICRGDGGGPARVCTRPAIRTILKMVK